MLYRGGNLILPSPRRRFQGLVLALPLVLCAYLFLTGESGIFQIRHRDHQIDELRLEIVAIKEENTRLENESALLQDDLIAIERIARERYGMVMPNESIYMVYPHLPDETPKSSP